LTPQRCQFTVSTRPDISPVFVAGRVKGRLQYAFRQAGQAVRFQRKLTVRAIGKNRREEVEAYIRRQVAKEALADPKFEGHLAQFTVHDPEVDLSRPATTASGRYWYNLHLVLVVDGRARAEDAARLGLVQHRCFAIAGKKGYRISTLSVMPDHLHVALQGNVEHSPEEIALAFQNNLPYALGNFAVWKNTYYVGTFGEYDMRAVRRP
jgi:REP element-mobilizing transposase RayT